MTVQPTAEDEAMVHDLLQSVHDKTKAAMDEGPDAQPVTLTPAEATLVHRLMFERR